LKDRPNSLDWKDVAFCNKFHFGIGSQVTKRIKRRKGRKYKYKASNIHLKKVITKDTKVKVREEDYLKLLNIFIVVAYDWKVVIPYKVLNFVGKMTIKVYT